MEITLTFEKFTNKKPKINDLRSDSCLFFLDGKFFVGYLHCNGFVYDTTAYYSSRIEKINHDKLWWRSLNL